jgi:splicing factor 1
MQELSGNPSSRPAGRIEAAPNPWAQGGAGDSYGGGDSKPWDRPQPSGGAAPWAQGRQESYGGRDNNSTAAPWAQSQSHDNYGGYGVAPGSNANPWSQQAPGQNYGNYGYGGYDQSAGYGAPPAPPGLSDYLAQYQQVPPPPPGDVPAPPPPDYSRPPPPPSGDVPPPPPPG